MSASIPACHSFHPTLRSPQSPMRTFAILIGRGGGRSGTQGCSPNLHTKRNEPHPARFYDSLQRVPTFWCLQVPSKIEQTRSFAFLIAAPPRLSDILVAQPEWFGQYVIIPIFMRFLTSF